MKRNALVATVAAMLIAWAALAGCQSPGARPGAAGCEFCTASLELLGTNPIYCRDTVQQAKAHGIDYRKCVDACLARDKEAMHKLFFLSSDEGVEGEAATEGHLCFVGLVLTRTGDAFFSECLARESRGTQESVRQNLLCAAGYCEGKVEILEALRKSYPLIFPETWRPK